MLKKEFSEIGLPILTRLAVALILPAAAWASKGEFDAFVAFLLLIGLSVAIAWIANHLGLSAFKSERSDRAWEYMLTFPLSRLRLLFYKAAPRLLILAGLIGLHSWIIAFASLPSKVASLELLLSPWPVAMLAVMLFVAGLSLSLFDLKSMRILAGLPCYLLFILVVEGGWARLFLPRQAPSLLPNWALAALVITAITGSSFWLVFRRFDLQGEAVHRRRYLVFALPPALLALGATLARILAR